MCKNKIVKYVIEIQNTSPFIIGTGKDGIEGLQIQDGYAKIPATSIAGLFRSELYKMSIQENKYSDLYEAIYLEKCLNETTENYKNKRVLKKAEKRRQSMMIVEDSFSKSQIDINKNVGKRTNISIDAKTGTAEKQKLFETIYINEGLKFQLEVQFRIIEAENKAKLDANIRADKDLYLLDQATKTFETFLEKLHQGDICIGAYENKGFGKFEIKQMSKTEYDFIKEEDLDKYIEDKIEPLTEYQLPKERSYAKDGYIIEMICSEGMIIKEEKFKDGSVTWVRSFRENGQNVYKIPASTLKGFTRAYCKSIHGENKLLDKLFGNNEMKGKLKFRDIEIAEEKCLRKHRICIDRFTGGALTGAMVNEELLTWEKPIKWEIDFSDVSMSEREEAKMMILQMIKALALGKIRIGSGSSVGYGKMILTDIQTIK